MLGIVGGNANKPAVKIAAAAHLRRSGSRPPDEGNSTDAITQQACLSMPHIRSALDVLRVEEAGAKRL
jgi:hypothetical protein